MQKKKKKKVNKKVFKNFLRSLYLMPDTMETTKMKFHKIHYRFSIFNLIKIQLKIK